MFCFSSHQAATAMPQSGIPARKLSHFRKAIGFMRVNCCIHTDRLKKTRPRTDIYLAMAEPNRCQAFAGPTVRRHSRKNYIKMKNIATLEHAAGEQNNNVSVHAELNKFQTVISLTRTEVTDSTVYNRWCRSRMTNCVCVSLRQGPLALDVSGAKRVFSNDYMRSVMLRFSQYMLALIVICALIPARAESPSNGFSFGIGPAQSTIELAKRWTPVMQYLSEKSGVPLLFKTAKDIPTFQQQMREGVYDFAFINPYHYLVFHKAAGYTAFAREKDGKLIGVLVVHKGGPVQELAQLQGQSVAFPTASALAATWMPIGMLKEKGIKVTPHYVKSMDSVYRSVAKGLFPAGGGEMRTLGAIDPDVKNQLRILWSSEALPPFTFAAHPRVPPAVVAKVQKAMDEMDQNPQGLELLKAINFKGVERADDADYNSMRQLNIKPVEAQ
jgi:phosphonate transport system substrate-binding protein